MIIAARFPFWTHHALALDAKSSAISVVTEKGCVYCAGKRAQLAGVTKGMDAQKAVSLFPEAALLERNPALEEDWVDQISMFFYGITPRLSYEGDGLWFLESKQDLRKAINPLKAGESAHFGVAADRSTAFIASLRAGEGHWIVIPEANKSIFLGNCPVSLLSGLGISEETVALLKWTGFETLQKVSGLSKSQLRLQFGEEGSTMIRLFYPGADEAKVRWFQPKAQIKAICERSWSELSMQIVKEISAEIASNLIQQLNGKGFQILQIKLISEKEVNTQKVLKEPVFKEDRLVRLLSSELSTILPSKANELFIEVSARAIRMNDGPVGDLFAKPGLTFALKRAERRFPGKVFHFEEVQAALFPEQAFRAAAFKKMQKN